ncbi:hypothetical protein ACVWZD_009001 [Streptomyces sp. TE3672]
MHRTRPVTPVEQSRQRPRPGDRRLLGPIPAHPTKYVSLLITNPGPGKRTVSRAEAGGRGAAGPSPVVRSLCGAGVIASRPGLRGVRPCPQGLPVVRATPVRSRSCFGLGDVDGLKDLAGVRPGLAPLADFQALHRPILHRQGPRCRRSLPRPAGEGPGLLRGREVADPGPEQVPAGPADDARRSRTPQPRLHPCRHHHLFAALEVATGKTTGSLHRRHRPIEFKKFLAKLGKGSPGRTPGAPDPRQLRNRLYRGRHGGRPPVFDTQLYKRRNVV